jgi:putative chitinase
MDTLKRGSKGDDVKLLQAKLGLKADGGFGKDTEKALIAWQTANGIVSRQWNCRSTNPDQNGLGQGFAAGCQSCDQCSSCACPQSHGPQRRDSRQCHRPNCGDRDQIQHYHQPSLGPFSRPMRSGKRYFQKGRGKSEIFGRKAARCIPKKFTAEQAKAYGGNPEKIGNRVYANIIGNGNEASGDGYRYRGRGYIQLTGKSNYQAFSDFIGEDCVANADWVATKYPLASAAHYFNGNKIWTTCDKGSTAATIKAVTLKVNKAALGLDERTTFFNKFWALLSKAV